MKIAVLSFGSISKSTHSQVYSHTLRIKGEFKQIDVKFPISLRRISSRKNDFIRLTVVITNDKNADFVNISAATSHYEKLSEAKSDLAQREGTKTDFIMYWQKQLTGWIGNTGILQEKPEILYLLRKWLEDNGYEAVIWSGLPANIPKSEIFCHRNIIPLLSADPILLENTRMYIKSLPYRNQLWQTILNRELFAVVALETIKMYGSDEWFRIIDEYSKIKRSEPRDCK